MNNEIFRGKSAVIDVGSNSVRLMFTADGKVLYKTLETTRLGEGLAFSPRLKDDAMRRTAEAISAFVARAKAEGAGTDFRLCHGGGTRGGKPRGVSGTREKFVRGTARRDRRGRGSGAGDGRALNGSDGATIDVGGASTANAVRVGGKTAYKKAFP